MKHLKGYKLFESIDTIESDIIDIKEIMNDIEDREEDLSVYIGKQTSALPVSAKTHPWRAASQDNGIIIRLFPSDRFKTYYFKINQNIKSTIQRLDYLYRNDYYIQYKYTTGSDWQNFYVYDDDRGLRSNGINLHGSIKTPPIEIYAISIVMNPKNNESHRVFESIDSDMADIKEIMNDITDNYDIYSDFDKGYLTKSKEDHIIFTLHGQFNSGGFFLDFTIDEYIESIFKRLNYTYSSEYIIKYYTQIIKNKKIKSKEFYVDEDGLFFNDEDIFGRVELVNMRVKYIKVEMTKKY
jgi:hypothetical protein